jgi:hypothetical protein
VPSWPFRRGHAAEPSVPPTPPSALDDIDESTPHRYRIWLASASDGESAIAVLEKVAVTRQLTIEVVSGLDGRAGMDIASTFDNRNAAVLTPLYALERAGVAVRGFEARDLVTELPEAALTRAVAAWDRFHNEGPHRHRLEVLAGPELIETCLGQARGSANAFTWRFAATCAAFNTPGSEAQMLRAAVETRDWKEADSFVDAAISRATLTTLSNEPFEPPADAVVALIGRGSYIGERGASLAAAMKAPLPDPVSDALCAASRLGGDPAIRAVAALDKAAPSSAVRQAVDDALASADPNLQAAALGVLAHHWGTDARPTWQAFLASRSAPLRQTAEQVLGLHGTADDLPDAAAHMATLARTKSSVHLTPPRGAEIVDLLARHRGDPAARAGLDDLSARWDRLGADLREWLEQHHPWLEPSQRGGAPVEQQAGPEEPLEWPPPTIEREGDVFALSFEDTDLFETRERFEELAAAHPRVELVDGDREWTSLKVSGDEPEALIRELWATAVQDLSER